MDELNGLAGLYQGPVVALAAQVPDELRSVVVSRFAVHMLGQTISNFRHPGHIAWADDLRAQHEAHASGQDATPPPARDRRGVGWPPNWLSLAMTSFPGIALAASAAGLNRRPLPVLPARYADARERQAACLCYWCLLYRSPSGGDEAALQIEARQGSPGPYADWLAENDPENHVYVHDWLEELARLG